MLIFRRLIRRHTYGTALMFCFFTLFRRLFRRFFSCRYFIFRRLLLPLMSYYAAMRHTDATLRRFFRRFSRHFRYAFYSA